METPLATALLLVLLWPLVSGRDLGWGVTREPLWHRYLAWGVAAGLAGLVRPEFLLVAPLALPWLLWFEYFRAGGDGGMSRPLPGAAPRAAAGRGRAAGWLVVGPWLIYAWLPSGGSCPGTAAAKSSGLSLDPAGSAGQPVAVAASIWPSTQGLLWVGDGPADHRWSWCATAPTSADLPDRDPDRRCRPRTGAQCRRRSGPGRSGGRWPWWDRRHLDGRRCWAATPSSRSGSSPATSAPWRRCICWPWRVVAEWLMQRPRHRDLGAAG